MQMDINDIISSLQEKCDGLKDRGNSLDEEIKNLEILMEEKKAEKQKVSDQLAALTMSLESLSMADFDDGKKRIPSVAEFKAGLQQMREMKDSGRKGHLYGRKPVNKFDEHGKLIASYSCCGECARAMKLDNSVISKLVRQPKERQIRMRGFYLELAEEGA